MILIPYLCCGCPRVRPVHKSQHSSKSGCVCSTHQTGIRRQYCRLCVRKTRQTAKRKRRTTNESNERKRASISRIQPSAGQMRRLLETAAPTRETYVMVNMIYQICLDSISQKNRKDRTSGTRTIRKQPRLRLSKMTLKS